MEVVKYYFRKCDECSKGISQGIWAEDEVVCSYTCGFKLWSKMEPFTTIRYKDGTSKGVSFLEFLTHIESIDDDDGIWDWFNGAEEYHQGCEWDEVYDKNGLPISYDDINPLQLVDGDSDLIDWENPICEICSHPDLKDLKVRNHAILCIEHYEWEKMHNA